MLLQREGQTSNVDASLDLLFLVGRKRNLLVGGSGEFSSLKSPAYRSSDRITQSCPTTETSNG